MEETRVLTIVFTDIKGFTERTSSSDRESVTKLLNKHEELLLPLVSAYDGRLVKTIGDAFLLTFASPTNAVLCAVMMQEKLKEFNAAIDEAEKIEIRVAINTGEVILREGDVFGEPVNIAARIEGLTEANEVWFSESTYLAMNRKEVPTSLIGDYRLKGIPEAIKIYRVLRDENDKHYLDTVKGQLERIKDQLSAKTLPQPTARPATNLFYIALALVLIFFLFGESKPDKHLRLAGEAKTQGNYLIAIDHLKEAAKERPGDEKILQAMAEAVNQHLEQRLKAGEKNLETFTKLESFLRETRALFPALEKKRLEAEVDLFIGKAEYLASAVKRKEADQTLDQLAKLYANDPGVLFKIAGHYKRFGYSWPRTIEFMYAAASAAPQTYATNTAVIEEFKWLFDSFPPSRGYENVRNFVLENCFAEFAGQFRDALYSLDKEHHSRRWNAGKMLEKKGEKIDWVRFYLTDLIVSPGNRDSQELQEIFAYFEKNAGPAMGNKIETALKTLPQTYPLFETYHFSRDDAAMRIAAGPLFPHLKTYFLDLITSDRISTRINGYTALKMRNELTPENAWQYALKTLTDFRMMQWSSAYNPALIEALDFAIKNDVPKTLWEKDDFKKLAKKAANAVKAMIDQDLEAEKNKSEKLYFKEDVRSQQDMEKLKEKLQNK